MDLCSAAELSCVTAFPALASPSEHPFIAAVHAALVISIHATSKFVSVPISDSLSCQIVNLMMAYSLASNGTCHTL